MPTKTKTPPPMPGENGASRRARVAPRPEATRGRLAPEHRAKLASSALDDNQIEALGWSTGINGRLQIPYLKPDGTREHCRDGKPFIRERLTAAEIKDHLGRKVHGLGPLRCCP